MTQRPDIQTLISRLQEPVRFIQVVSGPRQVGKTTMVRQVLKQWDGVALYRSADDTANVNSAWIESQWMLARLEMGDQAGVLALDEIQKVPQWSETVKRLWDEDRAEGRPLYIILLGSSQLMLNNGLTESLAGRFEYIRLPHWRFTEMRNVFGTTAEEYAWYGSYPGAVALNGDEQRWKSYIRESLAETAIAKDVLMMTRVDKPALLRRLFETGSLYSGMVLSYTKLMGQLQDAGNTTTLAHYLQLLDDAGLLCGIPKYAAAAVRTRASSPRFQTYNPALSNAFRPETFVEALHDPVLWGHVVESCVGAHLLAHRGSDMNIFYWREGDKEVDYVLQYKKKIVALEVKSGKLKTSGIEAFKAQFGPQVKSLIVGSQGIPWQKFIETDPRELF